MRKTATEVVERGAAPDRKGKSGFGIKIYMVLIPDTQCDCGACLQPVAAKLTRNAADRVAAKHKGAVVRRFNADKD